MIRCVRIWTGDDGNSLFEEGHIDLTEGMRGDAVGKPMRAVQLSFQETRTGGSYEWHQDPVPRFVITETLRINPVVGAASSGSKQRST